MRVIFTSHDDMAPYVTDIMSHLNKILVEISKNPSNPRFNHYVFESIGALVRWVRMATFVCPFIIYTIIDVLNTLNISRFNCQNNPEALSSFENMLFGPFRMILQQEVVG